MTPSAFVYKIHPAIGVARVGESEDYYLAPEAAGALPINPDGRPFSREDFRDASGAVRRQAARFGVFRDDGTPVTPGEDGIARIEWTVHLANKKAAWFEFVVSRGSLGY